MFSYHNFYLFVFPFPCSNYYPTCQLYLIISYKFLLLIYSSTPLSYIHSASGECHGWKLPDKVSVFTTSSFMPLFAISAPLQWLHAWLNRCRRLSLPLLKRLSRILPMGVITPFALEDEHS